MSERRNGKKNFTFRAEVDPGKGNESTNIVEHNFEFYPDSTLGEYWISYAAPAQEANVIKEELCTKYKINHPKCGVFTPYNKNKIRAGKNRHYFWYDNKKNYSRAELNNGAKTLQISITPSLGQTTKYKDLVSVSISLSEGTSRYRSDISKEMKIDASENKIIGLEQKKSMSHKPF